MSDVGIQRTRRGERRPGGGLFLSALVLTELSWLGALCYGIYWLVSL